jgi:FMN reductase
MSGEIVFVAGSPSPTSRSSFVAEAVAGHVKRAGLSWRPFSLGDFDPADVLFGRFEAPAVKAFIDAVKSSAALVLSTPVYKATYAGGLKAIVDLIPPDALVAKPALGIATTKLASHGVEVHRAYLALFAFFRARASETLVVLDDELRLEGPSGTLAPAAEARIERESRALIRAIEETSRAAKTT